MREKIVEKKEFDVLRKKNSLTGNRTPAACVTGRNTDHYTIKDRSNRGPRNRWLRVADCSSCESFEESLYEAVPKRRSLLRQPKRPTGLEHGAEHRAACNALPRDPAPFHDAGDAHPKTPRRCRSPSATRSAIATTCATRDASQDTTAA